MTKLFIENANKEAPASIRIYPLDENSQVIAPDSFTSMDDLGLSFGIALQPRPAIECVGVVAQIVCNGGKVESGWYNLSNNAPFELSVDGEVIGADFFFSSGNPQGNDRIKTELNKRGLDIEFGQEIG